MAAAVAPGPRQIKSPRGKRPIQISPSAAKDRADSIAPPSASSDASMIGVLGGTFDPIHFGHLRPALDCLQALALEEVRLIPLNVAVHRPQPVASSALRLAMLEAAIAGQPGFVADPRELERPGGSYTYDTLISLRAELGDAEPLCLLIGADAFAGFLDWHRPADILDLAHLVVMRRPASRPFASGSCQAFCSGRLCEDRAATWRRRRPGASSFRQ
jgi:nicotinate-nucleotide adenylyltransferase